MSHSLNRQWFVPGEGVAREVITADIQRYLGPDATVRPGTGTAEYEGVDGFWITAYRTLTSQMIQDLKSDSARWRAEISQGRGSMTGRDGKASKISDAVLVSYQDSQTHQSRQYYGPTTPAPSAGYQQPAAAAQYAQGYNYQQQPGQRYQAQSSQYPAGYGQEQARTPASYTYAPAPAAGHSDYYAQPQQDPRYTYHQQQAPQVTPRQDVYSPPQPSTTSQHYAYTQDGRPYAAQPPPPQANDRRRRQ